MKYKQLVTGDLNFLGIMYIANDGTGGVVVDERDNYVPTVFHLEWPQDVQDLVCTKDNPDGPIKNPDLEMAGLLLCWLVIEAVAQCFQH